MNRRTILLSALAAASVPFLAGCKPESLAEHIDAAAEDIARQIKELPSPGISIAVATVVNINDLDTSSTYGRAVGDMLSARLARLGVQVIDVRLRSALAHKPQGELALSREAGALAKANGVQAVLVGTYSVFSPMVHTTLRLVRVADNRVIASTSMEFRHEA